MSNLKKAMAVVASASTRGFKSLPDHPGIIALRRALKSERWDDQGGYVSYLGDGKWSFASSPVGQFTPEEMTALFDLVGLVPDVIKSKGSCEDCKHAKACPRPDGFVTFHNQGFGSRKCCSCKMPKMSNFVARKSTPKNRRYWCSGCGALFEKPEQRAAHAARNERGLCS